MVLGLLPTHCIQQDDTIQFGSCIDVLRKVLEFYCCLLFGHSLENDDGWFEIQVE